jgi:hypothetical protein
MIVIKNHEELSLRKICKHEFKCAASYIVCQEGVFFQLRTPLVMPSLLCFRSDIGQRRRLRTLPLSSALALGRHGNKVMPLLTLITLWRYITCSTYIATHCHYFMVLVPQAMFLR